MATYWAILVPKISPQRKLLAENLTLQITGKREVKLQAQSKESVHDALDSLIFALGEMGYDTRLMRVLSIAQETKGRHRYEDLSARGILLLPESEIQELVIPTHENRRLQRLFKKFYARIRR